MAGGHQVGGNLVINVLIRHSPCLYLPRQSASQPAASDGPRAQRGRPAPSAAAEAEVGAVDRLRVSYGYVSVVLEGFTGGGLCWWRGSPVEGLASGEILQWRA